MDYTSLITGNSFEIDNSATTFLVDTGTILATPAIGIFEAGMWHLNTIVVKGAVASQNGAASAILSLGSETTIHVDKTGLISGYFGIASYGASVMIVNDGTITADNLGIYANGDNAKIVNNGTVTGTNNYGIYLTDGELINSGTVNGGVSASGDGLRITNAVTGVVHGTVYVFSNGGEVTKTTNAGLFTPGASGSSYNAGSGNDTLINTGTIKGGVSLDWGNDTFDNRGGTVENAVYGDAGNDTFIIDKAITIIEVVGDGIDTVKSTVSLSLSAGLLAGQNLENLTLLGTGNTNATGNALGNIILGNSGKNALTGGGGADVVKGGSGADKITGGMGTDHLTGGTGADTFVFKTGFGKDTVTDFQNGTDRFDIRDWAAITGIADLKAHHVTVSGADLIIHAGSDSLILKDTGLAELTASDFMF